MAEFKKGQIKSGGRNKGSKNKIPRTVKQSYLSVFIALQDEEPYSLKSWAKNNLTEFYKLSVKLIPTEINAEVKPIPSITITPEEIKEIAKVLEATY